MANDSISTDPRMQEEARRAATESAIPKPPFAPTEIAKEEFERVVDKRYCDKTFEETWKTLTEDVKAPVLSDEVVGTFTEAEYRQFVTAIFYGINSFFLNDAAKKSTERGMVMHKAAMYTVCDRLKVDMAVPTRIDFSRALLRKDNRASTSKRTCILHPEGCPDDPTSPSDVVRSIWDSSSARSNYYP